jgi:hypothetical protein
VTAFAAVSRLAAFAAVGRLAAAAFAARRATSPDRVATAIGHSRTAGAGVAEAAPTRDCHPTRRYVARTAAGATLLSFRSVASRHRRLWIEPARAETDQGRHREPKPQM